MKNPNFEDAFNISSQSSPKKIPQEFYDVKVLKESDSSNIIIAQSAYRKKLELEK